MPSDDRTLWDAYAKGVKKTGSRKTSSRLKAAAPAAKKISKEMPKKTSAARKVERSTGLAPFSIEAKLDLHGLTQAEAFAALGKFIETQIRRGNRNLLVITGKGNTGQGILRAKLPEWLKTLGAPLLRFSSAAPKHGGEGAFYVILKRRKD